MKTKEMEKENVVLKNFEDYMLLSISQIKSLIDNEKITLIDNPSDGTIFVGFLNMPNFYLNYDGDANYSYYSLFSVEFPNQGVKYKFSHYDLECIIREEQLKPLKELKELESFIK